MDAVVNAERVKERPILFSGPMVQAILDGRKTQTRRVVRLPKREHILWDIDDMWGRDGCPPRRGDRVLRVKETAGFDRKIYNLKCPYGSAGDRLWVRETWTLLRFYTDREGYVEDWDNWEGAIPTRKTNDWHWTLMHRAAWEGDDEGVRWRPSIHMPRWASRIDLDVKSVRFERLQDISEHDARAEGMPPPDSVPALVNGEPGEVMFFDARAAFVALWDGINGKRALWSSNPLVRVVEFATRICDLYRTPAERALSQTSHKSGITLASSPCATLPPPRALPGPGV